MDIVATTPRFYRLLREALLTVRDREERTALSRLLRAEIMSYRNAVTALTSSSPATSVSFVTNVRLFFSVAFMICGNNSILRLACCITCIWRAMSFLIGTKSIDSLPTTNRMSNRRRVLDCAVARYKDRLMPTSKNLANRPRVRVDWRYLRSLDASFERLHRELVRYWQFHMQQASALAHDSWIETRRRHPRDTLHRFFAAGCTAYTRHAIDTYGLRHDVAWKIRSRNVGKKHSSSINNFN